MKRLFFLIITSAPMIAWSQATSSLMIPLNNQTIQSLGASSAQVDLLKEAKKLKPALNSVSQIEIQMLRLTAKSNIGGAQVFLKINNDFVASAVVETNPSQFAGTDPISFELFELRNIDRANISTASLQINNVQNIKMNSLEIIFGSVQEPQVFGDYADEQAAQIGGSGANPDTRPSQQVVNDIYGRYFAVVETQASPEPVLQNQPRPPTAAPARPQASVTARATSNSPNCLKDSRGKSYCIGDIVKNAWGFDQKIIAINSTKNEVQLISEMYDQPYSRHVDLLTR